MIYEKHAIQYILSYFWSLTNAVNPLRRENTFHYCMFSSHLGALLTF